MSTTTLGPGSPEPEQPATQRPVPPPEPDRASRSPLGAGRVTAIVVGALVALVSLGLLIGGLVLRVADGALRDEDGYLTSSAVALASPGHAITSTDIELHGAGALLPERWLGTIKVEAQSRAQGPVLVGVARSQDVDRYLRGVSRSVLTDDSGAGGDPEYRFVSGRLTPRDPVDARFWVASDSGDGLRTLLWEPDPGTWTLVVMNPDGSAPVRADVSIGATAPVLDSVALALLGLGLLLGLVAGVVLVLALRRPARAAPAA